MHESSRCFLVVVELCCQVGSRIDTARSSLVLDFPEGVPASTTAWTAAIERIETKHTSTAVKANVISIAELPR